MLRFVEDACVQCGLCKATCPEKVITLTRSLDFRAATATARMLKRGAVRLHPLRQAVRGEKHHRTDAPKLAGKHWMFQFVTAA